jgi:DNA-binding NtrC family response regulator
VAEELQQAPDSSVLENDGKAPREKIRGTSKSGGPYFSINCAATSLQLAESELFGHERGAFRKDLSYRLNVISITVPSLRERREDIPTLVGEFLAKLRVERRSNISFGHLEIASGFALAILRVFQPAEHNALGIWH